MAAAAAPVIFHRDRKRPSVVQIEPPNRWYENEGLSHDGVDFRLWSTLNYFCDVIWIVNMMVTMLLGIFLGGFVNKCREKTLFVFGPNKIIQSDWDLRLIAIS